MNKIRKTLVNRKYLLGLLVIFLVAVVIGFSALYIVRLKNINIGESYLVPHTKTTNSTTNEAISQDVNEIDREVNSINDNGFAEPELGDSNLGL
jgi:uncharacterized protein YxeA